MQKKRNSRHLIAETLSERIRKGKYKPGEKLPSRNTLAKEFNVHRNTMKEAFAILRNKGIIENAPGSCVKVASILSGALKVAVILPEHYGDMDILAGINESLKEHGASLEIMFYRTPEEQSQCLKRIREKNFSGTIIRPDFSLSGYGDICKVQEEKFPIVLIENFYQDSKGFYVDTGPFDAAVMAINHLKDIRRLSAGIISPSDRFGDAFIKGYQEAHLKLEEECYRNNIRRLEHGRTPGEASVELLKMKTPPRAIIYANPADAVLGYKALKEYGADLRCMKLLSFGEVPNNDLFAYPIVSIKRDFKELGRKAGELLVEYVKKPKEESTPGQTRKVSLGTLI